MSFKTDLVNDIAPSGKLKVALNFGNIVLAQRDPKTQEPKGVSVALAKALAGELGLDIEFHFFDSAGKVSDAVKQSTWDIAFLAIDPKRAQDIMFTSPYVLIEGTYSVHQDSPLQCIDDFDQPHVSIAVGLGTAYDLFLSRHLHHAQLIRLDTSKAALNYLLAHPDQAAAGVRQPLELFCQEHPSFRVIEGRFTAIEQAMGVPQGRPLAITYINDFLQRHKENGFVLQALQNSGQTAAKVAP